MLTAGFYNKSAIIDDLNDLSALDRSSINKIVVDAVNVYGTWVDADTFILVDPADNSPYVKFFDTVGRKAGVDTDLFVSYDDTIICHA